MRWLETSTVAKLPGRVIKQPANLGTAPGIFLPATYVLAADPAATMLIFPSDHFVFPRERFLTHIAELVTPANRYRDQIAILGVHPDRPESDYGWIEPGLACERSFPDDSKHEASQVSAFREKPSTAEATRFLNSGYLWNTMIMSVKAATLWQLGWRFLPEMMELFEMLRATLNKTADKSQVDAVLTDIYQHMQPRNFFRDLLQRAIGDILVAPMDDVDWDDWGRPERIVDSLARIGRRPAFLTSL